MGPSAPAVIPATPVSESDLAAFPLRAGAVDVGSNAIRLLAAEFTAPGRWQPIVVERSGVRLGHSVFLTGRLTGGAMDRAVAALAGFRATLARLEVQHVRAVATSAVREARNGEKFVSRVRREAGLELELISGSEEARLIHRAVAERLRLGADPWLLVDLGGGSVEVSLADDSGILWSESHTMGSVRLLEELAGADDEPGRFRRLLAEYVGVLQIPGTARGRTYPVVATGGNIESLARLAGEKGSGAGTPARLPVERLREVIERLSRLSFRQRVEELELREDRADVILPAAVVYERIAHLAGADEILVPGVGVREGVALDLVASLTSRPGHAERRERDLMAAAVSLGQRYRFDEQHGRQVAHMAESLFDQTAALHGLGDSDRSLLVAAALLHDVGSFVSYKGHHRHSQYILSHSELPGFSAQDMHLLGAVARYHRKGEPSAQHPEYARLSPAEQVRVARLSAIVRLADALDREHRAQVRGVRAELKEGAVRLHLDGSGDLLLERWALQKKRGLFERVFGLRVTIGNGGKDP